MHPRAFTPLQTYGYHVPLQSQRAQGTIEYLVILTIVIVLGLFVVGLSTTIFSESSVQVGSSSGSLSNKIGVGGISISEAVTDISGDAIISLSNNSGENLTLTKITPMDSRGNAGTDNNYNNALIMGNEKIFSLSGINTTCPCNTADPAKTCTFKLTLTTAEGLTKTLTTSITVQCVQNATAMSLQNVISPTHSNCWSDTAIPHPICTLSDLNRVREHLDWNYTLQADINATDTRSWNNGIGFIPLETYSGEFNGNDYTITGLYVNTTSAYVGLFSQTTSSAILTNLRLTDVNVSTTNNWAGALVGKNSGYISSITIDGNLYGAMNGTGMLAGQNIGRIEYSSVSGKVAGKWHLGGFVGLNTGPINNSFSSCDVTGPSSPVGGFIGSNYGPVYNSYATGTVSSTSALQVGGFIGLNNANIFESYSTGTLTVSGVYAVGGFIGDSFSSTVRNSISMSGVNSGNGFFGILEGSGTSTNNYWDISRTGKSNGGCSSPNCTGVNNENTDPTWAYYDTNEPLASWGTWTNVSGNTYSTTDGNWSICRGTGLPWLTWENRTC